MINDDDDHDHDDDDDDDDDSVSFTIGRCGVIFPSPSLMLLS